MLEATHAATSGASEIDMVVNIGKVLGGDWDYVSDEIQQVNNAVVKHGAALKVIFENDYLSEKEIVRLCEICSRIQVVFIKTSTGYAFVKQLEVANSYKGASVSHLKLMLAHRDSKVQVKAAGRVRALDDLLKVMALGVTRVGATATASILKNAIAQKTSELPKEVRVNTTNSLGG